MGVVTPMTTNRLQTLQSGLSSPKKKIYISQFQMRYKNSSDWRVWSFMESYGAPSTTAENDYRNLRRHFEVSSQCRRKWEAMNPEERISGHICICGHPESSHEYGGLCSVGPSVCNCRRPRLALWVDDLRYFYRATKGPHEAHALVLGLGALIANRGSASYKIDWSCEMRSCSGTLRVNPARFRNGKNLSMGTSVHDTHKLICEPCLFMGLNGGYVYE